MVSGDRLNAFPKQRTQLIGLGKISERFTMDARLAFSDLQANCRNYFALRIVDHLEFGDALAQFWYW